MKYFAKVAHLFVVLLVLSWMSLAQGKSASKVVKNKKLKRMRSIANEKPSAKKRRRKVVRRKKVPKLLRQSFKIKRETASQLEEAMAASDSENNSLRKRRFKDQEKVIKKWDTRAGAIDIQSGGAYIENEEDLGGTPDTGLGSLRTPIQLDSTDEDFDKEIADVENEIEIEEKKPKVPGKALRKIVKSKTP